MSSIVLLYFCSLILGRSRYTALNQYFYSDNFLETSKASLNNKRLIQVEMYCFNLCHNWKVYYHYRYMILT